MLEELLSDALTRTDASSNQPLFRSDIDYDEIAAQYREAMSNWGKLPEEERQRFDNDARKFLAEKQIPDTKDPTLAPAKNFSLMRKETDLRVAAENPIQLLPIEGLDFESSVLELITNSENTEYLRDLYRSRKLSTGTSTNAGINATEARRIKNCLSQGRELYIAGRNGSLLVKPLNYFYALTAYAFGIIILNNPIRYNKGNLPGSHGLEYLPATIEVRFGGDTARGTFSDLATSFPAHVITNKNLTIIQDSLDSVMKFYDTRFTVGTGLLMSLLPEMAEYYKLVTGRNSRAHPLDIVNANDPRSLKWSFQIGDGENPPPIEKIQDEFEGFPLRQQHGRIVVTVSATEANRIRACIYTDIRGRFWYIDNPFSPVILPEICLHFLILNVYSCIMRYRPDDWGEVLLNEVSPHISLITRRYFSALERKFFLIILRSVSRFFPYVVETSG